MSWVFYILFANTFFSISDLFDKFFNSKKIKSVYTFGVLVNLAYFIPIFITSLFLWKTFVFGTPMIWALVGQIFYFFMWIFFWKAIKTGEISRVISIFFTQPVFSAILGILIFKEIVLPVKWLGIILITIGGIFSSFENKRVKKGFDKVYLFAFISAIFALFGNIISKYAMIKIPPLTVLLIQFYGSFLLYGLFLLNKNIFNEVKNNLVGKKSFYIIFIRTLINYAGNCFFVLSLSAGPISLVSALNSTQPLFILVFSTLATLFFPKIIKEKIDKANLTIKISAAVLIVLGAIIVSV